MSDFEDDIEALGDGSPLAESDNEDGSKPHGKKGGKAAAKSKGKAKDKNKPDKACYIPGCPNTKSGKQKCCSDHKKVVEAILYQADKAGKKAEVEKILLDPVTAAKAVRDFEADNPPGRFRKKIIDFTVFLKTYSVETVQINRDCEENYTFQDFSDEKTAAGWEASAILSKWQEYDSNPSIDREEDGSLWLPQKRQRIRDDVKRVS